MTLSHLDRGGVQGADRAMHFYHRVAAPALTGSLNKMFWTTVVVQVANQEPVAGHAVLALSSLYENFSKGAQEAAPFAAWHYNEAIRLLRTTKDRALVLFVCVLFVCIELFRKNPQDAIAHYRHGINILNEMHSESDFLRNHVVPTMRQLSLVPYCYGVNPRTFPTIDRPVPSASSQFASVAEAHARQLPLHTRVARFLRIGEERRLAKGCKGPEPDRKWTRNFILLDLDSWYAAFETLKDSHQHDDKDQAVLYLLETRYLTSRIELSQSQLESECDCDAYLDDYRHVVDLASKVAALSADPGSSSVKKLYPDDSAIELGFSPLLFTIVAKCRFLSVRTAALKLMGQLARPRDNIWAKRLTLAMARRIIEIEHQISLGDMDLDGRIKDGELPPEERRVVRLDYLSAEKRKRGPSTVITFFFRDPGSGNLIPREEWVTLEKKPSTSP
ncbi:uncharacterized protein ColSpa_07803 [Colletotrichum spaethianum]|uniref:C6 zinc finger domain protein n=1 Tax=Colletotrichum spaethianum TaxID=700344 RepID=A0AA37P8I7_9PEZI|nr:uncharacterized protein ColSpa_07803 [Colletotrichum spaethianum]GKT47622.1 hypothetical protein ColSpa_07803 [Colletotrichum spaethianum]